MLSQKIAPLTAARDALAQLGPYQPARLETGLLFNSLGLGVFAHRHLADFLIGNQENVLQGLGRGEQDTAAAVVLDDTLTCVGSP